MIELKLIGLDPMAVPVRNLRAMSDPLATPPWTDRCGRRIAQIHVAEVESAIDRADISPSHWVEKWSFSRGQHIARIAALVVDPDPTPIEIDVGFPGHGYFTSWVIFDGNHRLAAAIVRRDAAHVENVLGVVPQMRVVT